MSSSREKGGILAGFAHVLLLMVVLGQVVYLASRHRLRWDLTSDNMWSLTDSTRNLIGRLDKQLLIEAYFSPKENLPVSVRDSRAVLENFLDELVQLGRGRVVVQRFDPNSDKAISDRCARIGVQPIDLRGGSATSVSFDRHWQGLRFMYGGSKQKVLPQVAPASSFVAEAVITPAVKEVAQSTKTEFGFMEWPVAAPGGRGQGLGWNVLRSHEGIAKRFAFQNYKSEDSPLVPEDVETLFLFRPSSLTDRDKYVIDQFVVSGGTLVVFADASEYTIGQRRQMTRMPLLIDAPTSERKFVDQLAHYGIDWKPMLLCDLIQEAHVPRNRAQPQEYFGVQQQTPFGAQWGTVLYPYFFHAVARDWSTQADRFARDADGAVDADLAKRYRSQFVSGISSDEFLFTTFKNIKRGPGFYWPTWVGLRSKAGGVVDLPEGVEGKVHLWSSPAVLAEEPPASLNPLGTGDARTQGANYQKFMAKLNQRFMSEPRQQAPLMCEVSGTFSSFFANGERPLRPSEIKEQEAKKAAEEAAQAAAEAPGQGEGEGEQKPKPDPIGPEPPPQPEPDTPAAEAERDMVTVGEQKGRIVMIGDSDFLRDDFVRGDHARAGGPYAVLSGVFFSNMLDWLAEDRDLVELQSRATTDRTMKFVDDPAPGTDPRAAERSLMAKTLWLRVINIGLPILVLSSFGLIVFMMRRNQKRAFLESVG